MFAYKLNQKVFNLINKGLFNKNPLKIFLSAGIDSVSALR